MKIKGNPRKTDDLHRKSKEIPGNEKSEENPENQVWSRQGGEEGGGARAGVGEKKHTHIHPSLHPHADEDDTAIIV